jgi:hypothetical protein
MGLFGKLKANMTHGGVKVHVQAPSSVPGNQVIPVQVTITADSPQTIDSVKAEIKAQVREQGLNIGGMGGGMGVNRGVGVEDRRTNYQTVAQVESRESFTLSPGETKTVTLQLFINGSAGSGNPLGQLNNMGGALGGVLQSVVSAAQGFEHVNYVYSVHASANVQGVALDPSDKQPIQILPPAAAAQPIQPAAQPADTLQSTTQPITQPLSPTPAMPQPVQPVENIASNPEP